ncbi:MAG TPA: DegV family protein [Mycobacteriales bacterium]|nr:DegV family protein [Mycobacteriales bacterium]
MGAGGRVAVVTDSTACLPSGVAASNGVEVVPLQVSLGDRHLLEGVDLSPDEFARWITAPGRVAVTSQPAPAAFHQAWDRVAAECIVSVHLSSGLSGTTSAAQVAARTYASEVRVVDSMSTAMGLGFPVLAGAEVAAAGGSVEEVVAAVDSAVSRTRTFFYVDTLDHLRRGGRIGVAAALVGTALAVKPLLHIKDGRIDLLEKVRTSAKAIARLEDLVRAEARGAPVDIAVHHLAAPERARLLADRLRSSVPGLKSMLESEVGAVVGAHVGPGLLGVVVLRR